MATAATIPVRLPEELLQPLDSWAKAAGLSRAAAIKLCIAKQLGAIETADAAALRALDGRSYRYQGKPAAPAPAENVAESTVDSLLEEVAPKPKAAVKKRTA
jgi:predicted DNA-binding protein